MVWRFRQRLRQIYNFTWSISLLFSAWKRHKVLILKLSPANTFTPMKTNTQLTLHSILANSKNVETNTMLMWAINHFQVYDILSYWIISSRLAFPICMERTKMFFLNHSHKISYFDYHHQSLSHDYPFRRNKKTFKKKICWD